jgi:hypothetical protein
MESIHDVSIILFVAKEIDITLNRKRDNEREGGRERERTGESERKR